MYGGYLIGDFEGKVSYQGMRRRKLFKRVSVSVGVPLGNLGGVHLLGTCYGNGASLSMVDLLGEPGRGGGSFTRYPEGYAEEVSGDGHLSP
jgi:hypothetical protein